jgi:papilin
VRPATGPNREGCVQLVSCVGMLYGCCPDGMTPANGPNMAGCDLVDVTLPNPTTSTSAVLSQDDVTTARLCMHYSPLLNNEVHIKYVKRSV